MRELKTKGITCSSVYGQESWQVLIIKNGLVSMYGTYGTDQENGGVPYANNQCCEFRAA
jgi:hypothetical protein